MLCHTPMEVHKPIVVGIFVSGFILNFSFASLESKFFRDLRKICIDGVLVGLGLSCGYLWYVSKND